MAYSELTKTAIIIELTVCFETNFEEAKERKESKYRDLIEEVEGNDYMVDFLTVEVGSRGFVNYGSFTRLKDTVGASNRELQDLLFSISRAVIKESFIIWTGRNHAVNT